MDSQTVQTMAAVIESFAGRCVGRLVAACFDLAQSLTELHPTLSSGSGLLKVTPRYDVRGIQFLEMTIEKLDECAEVT